MTCACCGSEIPDQFATEFCDACHDPIKLRALVQQQKNIIALLGQPIPYVTTKTVANAEDLPPCEVEVPEILRVIPKKHYTVEYVTKAKYDARDTEIERLTTQRDALLKVAEAAKRILVYRTKAGWWTNLLALESALKELEATQ